MYCRCGAWLERFVPVQNRDGSYSQWDSQYYDYDEREYPVYAATWADALCWLTDTGLPAHDVQCFRGWVCRTGACQEGRVND